MNSSKASFPIDLPEPRPEVKALNPYTAPLEGRRELLRLDFNENTVGPSPLVLEALRDIQSSQISIYPEYKGLKQAVANNLNTRGSLTPLTSHQIGLFNGVDAAIHAIFHAYGDRKDKLLTTIPTFGYYKPCALMQGMEILTIPYEEGSFKYPFEKILKELVENNPKILIICNPNNPTGTTLSTDQILTLATTSPKTLIVIDELYEAFSGNSLLPIVDFNITPNLVVLRSLSKVAGLAGLRIGFAIGNESIINDIKRVTGPYDVNSFAVQAAFAALSDQQFIDDYVAEVFNAREWIKTKLVNHNIRHHMNGGNFFLIWPKNNSSKIELSLKSKGILVRKMKDEPLINGSIRVSIGTTSQMKRFWEVFKEI